MSVALQIRDVPDDVRDTLTAEARRRGQSVQAYLLELVQREAQTLHNADVFDRTQHLRVELDLDPVDIVREGRDRGFQVDREPRP